MSVSFNPTQATNSPIEVVENKKEEPKTSLFKIPSVKKLILGALATQGAAMAPKANAAFGSYAICVAMCTATGTPPPICLAGCSGYAVVNPFFLPMVPTCHSACMLLGFAPTP